MNKLFLSNLRDRVERGSTPARPSTASFRRPSRSPRAEPPSPPYTAVIMPEHNGSSMFVQCIDRQPWWRLSDAPIPVWLQGKRGAKAGKRPGEPHARTSASLRPRPKTASAADEVAPPPPPVKRSLAEVVDRLYRGGSMPRTPGGGQRKLHRPHSALQQDHHQQQQQGLAAPAALLPSVEAPSYRSPTCRAAHVTTATRAPVWRNVGDEYIHGGRQVWSDAAAALFALQFDLPLAEAVGAAAMGAAGRSGTAAGHGAAEMEPSSFAIGAASGAPPAAPPAGGRGAAPAVVPAAVGARVGAACSTSAVTGAVALWSELGRPRLVSRKGGVARYNHRPEFQVLGVARADLMRGFYG